MKLTKKQAIAECKEVWKPVAEGEAHSKDEALYLLKQNNRELYLKISDYYHQCPLCQYKRQFDEDMEDCGDCPYYQRYEYWCDDEEFSSYITAPQAFAQNVMKL